MPWGCRTSLSSLLEETRRSPGPLGGLVPALGTGPSHNYNLTRLHCVRRLHRTPLPPGPFWQAGQMRGQRLEGRRDSVPSLDRPLARVGGGWILLPGPESESISVVTCHHSGMCQCGPDTTWLQVTRTNFREGMTGPRCGGHVTRPGLWRRKGAEAGQCLSLPADPPPASQALSTSEGLCYLCLSPPRTLA